MLSPSAFTSASLLLLVTAIWLSLYDDFQFFSSSTEKNQISVVIFEFENFANDIAQTASAACHVSPAVFIFSETFIYPPVNFTSSINITGNCQVKVIEQHKSPYSSYIDHNFYHLINSEYVLLMPDATRIISTSIQTLIIDKLEHSQVDGLLFPVYSDDKASSANINCRPLRFDVKRWTLHYFEPGHSNDQSCDYFDSHQFALFIRTKALFRLHSPFNRPFLHSFAIQSQIANLSTKLIADDKIFAKQPTKLFTTDRQQNKHAHLEQHRTSQLYGQLGIKKVIFHDDKKSTTTHWHGCDRLKPRCFGTIINDIPDYLIQHRWTPPCCLRNLAIVGRYALELLSRFSIRYWLEGGSLLGAARNGQIIEWDYDIDVGIYREDAAKLPILRRLLDSESGTQMEDGQGFLWEKALEGDFVKVHYSRRNRMHIDIFPFVSVNGTMTKDTWLEDHPQDMPFPEHFLTPLTTINFIDIQASAPNNIRAFLELKFGAGVLENAKYPRDLPSWDAH